jgi:formylglycine-generating enzyme required for sulfatase activity
MLGSVYQWMADRYDEKYYTAASVNDPPGAASGDHRALRGSSGSYGERVVRASFRASGLSDGQAKRADIIGFRCVGE